MKYYDKIKILIKSCKKLITIKNKDITRWFWLVLVLEIVIIGYIGFYIFITISNQNKLNIVNTVKLNPLRKEDLIAGNSKYRYFYEPRPDTVISHPQEWLQEIPNYTINSDSLNERFEYSESKEPDTFRIITLGDSHTFGYYLTTADNYPEQLETFLTGHPLCSKKHIEVINLGVFGYDIAYSVERFALRGQKYNPDLVIWLLKKDDFEEIAEKILPQEFVYRQQFEKTEDLNKEMMQIKKLGYHNERHKAKVDLKKQLGEQGLLNIQINNIQSIDKYYAGPVVFFTYKDEFKGKEAYSRIIREFAKSRPNTYYIEDLPNVMNIKGALLPDLHPNKNGYQLIAKSIESYLISTSNDICR